METNSGSSGTNWVSIILGFLLLLAIAGGAYLLLKKPTRDGGDGSNGDGNEPPAPTDAQLEEEARIKFMADCKSAGLSEVFCNQAWNNSDKKTSFSDFASSGYGVSGGACVPHTQKQREQEVKACWQKCLPWAFVPVFGGAKQMDCFHDCTKKILPVITCP